MGLRTLADLKTGESGIIDRIEANPMLEKLLEMGFVPGEEVSVRRIAYWTDPMAVEIMGYSISIRKDLARSIVLRGDNG